MAFSAAFGNRLRWRSTGGVYRVTRITRGALSYSYLHAPLTRCARASFFTPHARRGLWRWYEEKRSVPLARRHQGDNKHAACETRDESGGIGGMSGGERRWIAPLRSRNGESI